MVKKINNLICKVRKERIITKDIYIGVDGGATNCRTYIEDANGGMLASANGGSANIRLSVDVCWNSVYSTIRDALNKIGLTLEDKTHNFHIGLGLAGVEIIADRKRFLARPHPFTSIRLESDAYAACLGAHNNQDGGIIIIGTGVNGFQIQNEKTVQVSGWGFPHDDIGGGAWLGLQATSLTLQWLDGRIPSSPMLEEIHREFNEDVPKFVAWANKANSTEFAKLAPYVINHIKTEDIYAHKLIKQAAAAIDQVYFAMQKRAIDKSVELPICLFGGIAPFIRPWLCTTLQKHLTERVHDAAVGAVFMIRNQQLQG